MSKSTALWSEMGKSVMSRLVGVMLVQQIKSSIWPLLWVGRLTCCLILRQSRSDVKWLAKILGGRVVSNTDVSSDKNSLWKTVEGFGGL